MGKSRNMQNLLGTLGVFKWNAPKNNSAGLLCHVLVCVRSHEGVVRRNAGDNLTSMLNLREKTRFGERNEI